MEEKKEAMHNIIDLTDEGKKEDKKNKLCDILSDLEELAGVELKSLVSLIGALDCYMVDGNYNPPDDLLSVPAETLRRISEKANNLINKALTELQTN